MSPSLAKNLRYGDRVWFAADPERAGIVVENKGRLRVVWSDQTIGTVRPDQLTLLETGASPRSVTDPRGKNWPTLGHVWGQRS